MPLEPGEGRWECRRDKEMGAKMEDKRRARVQPAGWERSVGGGRHVSGMEAGTVHPAQCPLTRSEVKAEFQTQALGEQGLLQE